ncbi:MAG: hypothetical protein ACREOU_12340 [Candidatus Eiseniibacteriota bacterium]
MNPLIRLGLPLCLFLFGLTLSKAATAGDHLPQIDCDSLSYSPPETGIVICVWNKGFNQICTTEIRPLASPERNLPPVPILGCEAPPGWTWEPMEEEPGAIVLNGCVPPSVFELGPPVTIRIAGRAGRYQASFYDEDGLLWRDFVTLLYCGSAPVRTQAKSWGSMKSAYR